mmetsp:Transcript_3031/g.5660  ORF Transcript_3031/g.5660 Transcript_3031/m.5660 type:complete len:215 (-) Transcript_3031:7943-8587(-)
MFFTIVFKVIMIIMTLGTLVILFVISSIIFMNVSFTFVFAVCFIVFFSSHLILQSFPRYFTIFFKFLLFSILISVFVFIIVPHLFVDDLLIRISAVSHFAVEFLFFIVIVAVIRVLLIWYIEQFPIKLIFHLHPCFGLILIQLILFFLILVFLIALQSKELLFIFYLVCDIIIPFTFSHPCSFYIVFEFHIAFTSTSVGIATIFNFVRTVALRN